MSNQRGQSPPSKAPSSSAISGSPAELLLRVKKLEDHLAEHFNEKNQWNSEVRQWVGKRIRIYLIFSADPIVGLLRWMDRYTICVEDEVGTAIVHKGAVALLRLDPGG